jgi:hypothetical protein
MLKAPFAKEAFGCGQGALSIKQPVANMGFLGAHVASSHWLDWE